MFCDIIGPDDDQDASHGVDFPGTKVMLDGVNIGKSKHSLPCIRIDIGKTVVGVVKVFWEHYYWYGKVCDINDCNRAN